MGDYKKIPSRLQWAFLIVIIGLVGYCPENMRSMFFWIVRMKFTEAMVTKTIAVVDLTKVWDKFSEGLDGYISKPEDKTKNKETTIFLPRHVFISAILKGKENESRH